MHYDRAFPLNMSNLIGQTWYDFYAYLSEVLLAVFLILLSTSQLDIVGSQGVQRRHLVLLVVRVANVCV